MCMSLYPGTEWRISHRVAPSLRVENFSYLTPGLFKSSTFEPASNFVYFTNFHVKSPIRLSHHLHYCIFCLTVSKRFWFRWLLLLLRFIKITSTRNFIVYVLMARTISCLFAALTREILFLLLEHKTYIFVPPCNTPLLFHGMHAISFTSK